MTTLIMSRRIWIIMTALFADPDSHGSHKTEQLNPNHKPIRVVFGMGIPTRWFNHCFIVKNEINKLRSVT